MEEIFRASRRVMNLINPSYITVQIPYHFERKTLYEVLNKTLTLENEVRSQRIQFDFSRLSKADPTAITVLSNLIEYLTKKRVRIEYLNYGIATAGNKYLDDCGFFSKYVGKQIFPNSRLRESTLPLEIISHDRSFSWIENTFSPWIESKVNRTDDSFTTIKLCLGEVFNNIRDHSGEIVGSVFAQYYPGQKEVMLSISDFGRGIPTNVRKQFPSISDEDAIIKATIEGFTTKSTVRNRGIGLHILTQNVVKNNGGSIWIDSLRGSVRCISAASGVRKLICKQEFSYPGTLLEMKFNTDKLEVLGAKEEYEW
jgi:ABC-type transporter Mla MlaB component/anti-sigma regulatory factor (Ser/Thr protein kinase)